ncbi:helix-turn-helix domain-containing protein [Pyxidicoccus sp. QH1ED-7-1]|nr:helix-turn-helix domain-containing protein [Pyxidicoccus xibeiensis]
MGLPLRPYILWLRLRRAAEHLKHGAPVTQAAHAAGFTDSAHLSHAFRRTFGLTPTEIAGVVEWVLPPPE